MAQKYLVKQNKNSHSKTFGKYYAQPVAMETIGTDRVADFIQTQCSVKTSDIIATLNELGGALKHYFELGYRVQLDGLGAFKPSFSSLPADTAAQVSAASIKKSRVIFQPERQMVKLGQRVDPTTGKVSLKRAYVSKMVSDMKFVETAFNDVSHKPATNSTGTGDDDGE